MARSVLPEGGRQDAQGSAGQSRPVRIGPGSVRFSPLRQRRYCDRRAGVLPADGGGGSRSRVRVLTAQNANGAKKVDGADTGSPARISAGLQRRFGYEGDPALCCVAWFGLSILFGQTVPELCGCPVFPPDNIWNTPVDSLPLDPGSAVYIDTIGRSRGLHPDFGSGLWASPWESPTPSFTVPTPRSRSALNTTTRAIRARPDPARCRH